MNYIAYYQAQKELHLYDSFEGGIFKEVTNLYRENVEFFLNKSI